MDLNLFQRLSIKTRVTLFTLVIFLVSIWSLAFYASLELRNDMQRLLGEQQLSTASFIAAEVNDELSDRLAALEQIAKQIDSYLMGNPAALQAQLEQRPILQIMFNGGTIITGTDGTAIADVPLSTGRVGVNYIDVDTIAVALKEGRSTIGRPVIGRKLLAPVFGMTAPIRDAQGRVVGALYGVTNLGKPNFLDKITNNAYGKTGGYLLVDPKSRLIITSTDKSQIMQPLPAPGINWLNDRHVQGFDETGVTVNPLGVEVLASAKRIPVAGWFIEASLPTAEAFAPIHDMQQRMFWAVIFLTLLAGGLTWWMIRRELLPMLTTIKKLATLSESNQPLQPLPIIRQDEIGALVGGFNRLLENLKQREADLSKQKEFFHLIAENIGDFIAVLDRDGRRLYNSPSYRKFFGSSSDLRGTNSFAEIHPDDQQRVKLVFKETVQTGIGRQLDYRFLMADGSLREMESFGSVIRDSEGRVERVVVVSHDITERKLMEDKVRQLAFYDPLTNLPNRRLLSDRLNQTMAASLRSACYCALIFLDLDNFKPLNDMYGHEVGDLLLIEAAQRLRSCVREMDTVARFGGDEFVVIISELDADKSESASKARFVAEKIHATLSETYRLTMQPASKTERTVEHICTASIGVALFINHEASQDDILKWADAAMYQAKEAGGNLIRFCDAQA